MWGSVRRKKDRGHLYCNKIHKIDSSHVASVVPFYQGVGVEGSASSFAMQVVSTIFLAVYTQV